MTYNDLYKEIIALGFESEIDSQDRLLASVNRALNTIFTERAVFSDVNIYQRKYAPSLKIKRIEHKGTESDTVSYNARCYSFISSGVGSYKICEGEDERIFSFSGENQLHKGFLHGEGKIEFFGDYSFIVTNLSVFDELFGEGEEHIPLISEYREYDVDDYADSFLSFASLPTDKSSRAIKGAIIRGKKIRIPCDYEGWISLTYRRGAKKATGLAEEEIFLPCGCEHLLPLLTAAYVWLDDDSEKAEYYMSLYREGMSAVKYYNRTSISDTYQSTNGWA